MMPWFRFYLLLSFKLLLLVSCGTIVNKPKAPIQTFETPGEYLREGKNHFDAGRFVEAQRYLVEAIRLDSNNQAARVLAGVTWVKLGNASNARREFESAIGINQSTGDAATARSWRERLQHPLPVATFPFEKLSTTGGYGIERLCYQTLQRYLFESGLYSILDEKQLGYWRSQKGSRESQACQVARDKGAKIALLGIISDFQLAQDKPPRLYLGERVSSFYAATLKVTLQIYATGDCRLVDTFSRSVAQRQIPDRNRDAALQQMVDRVFQQLAMNIHATLM
jgi:tetratricopeptide (TPR) repeat protein